MAEKIYSDLKEYITKKFPKVVGETKEEGEAANHNSFARCLTRVYSPNQKYFFLLDKYVATERDPIVVVGEPGIGMR